MINYKGNQFKIISEKVFQGYKDVVAVGKESVAVNFRVWDDGLVEFKKK